MPFLSFFSKRKTKSTDRLHCIRDNLYSFLLENTVGENPGFLLCGFLLNGFFVICEEKDFCLFLLRIL